MASQITSLTIVYSIVYSDADKRKHQSSASLAFVRGIHRGPVNSPQKWPVTREMIPFGDVIMLVSAVRVEYPGIRMYKYQYCIKMNDPQNMIRSKMANVEPSMLYDTLSVAHAENKQKVPKHSFLGYIFYPHCIFKVVTGKMQDYIGHHLVTL